MWLKIIDEFEECDIFYSNSLNIIDTGEGVCQLSSAHNTMNHAMIGKKMIWEEKKCVENLSNFNLEKRWYEKKKICRKKCEQLQSGKKDDVRRRKNVEKMWSSSIWENSRIQH